MACMCSMSVFFESLKTKIQELQESNKNLLKESEEVKQVVIRPQEEKISKLESDLVEKTGAVSNFENLIKKLEEERNGLRDALEEKVRAIESLSTKEAEFKLLKSSLEEELDAAKRSVEASESGMENMLIIAGEATEDRDSTRRRLEEAEAETRAAAEKLKTKEKELEELTKSFQSQIDLLTENVAELEQFKETAEPMLASAVCQQLTDDKNKVLKAKLKVYETKIQELKNFQARFLSESLREDDVSLKSFNSAIQNLKKFFQKVNFEASASGLSTVQVKREPK